MRRPLPSLWPSWAGRCSSSRRGSARRSESARRIPRAAALREAFRHDRKVLVEECMRGREVECGVIEDADGTLTTSLPGEIVPTNRHAFYTYEAKYLDEDGAVLKVPADIPKAVVNRIQDVSARASGARAPTSQSRREPCHDNGWHRLR